LGPIFDIGGIRGIKSMRRIILTLITRISTVIAYVSVPGTEIV